MKQKKKGKADFSKVKSGSSSSADPKAMRRLEKAKKRIAKREKENKYRGMSGQELKDAEFNQKARKQRKMQEARKERSDTMRELRGG